MATATAAILLSILCVRTVPLYKEVALPPSSLANKVMAYEENLRKGPWLEEEDETLTAAIALLGERRWDALAKTSGLRRSGKSCRLRWLNYLRPNLKHGEITEEEEFIIIQLHKQWGNKWAKIARRLPGRTDNEIKNYWRSHLRKKLTVLAQEQDHAAFGSALKQDSLVPICDAVEQSGSDIEDYWKYEKDEISGTSDDSSSALNELCNTSFAYSPYEAGVSDWMSSSWTYELSHEVEQLHSHSRDCSSLYLCYCYPSWGLEEESDASIWDCSSSFWS